MWIRQEAGSFPCGPEAAAERPELKTRDRSAERRSTCRRTATSTPSRSGTKVSSAPKGGIVNTGRLQAQHRDGSGGRVEITGGRVNLAAGTVDASGGMGRAGGEVEMHGSDVTIGADASVTVAG